MKDQIIVITGGATGMGLAFAKELVKHNTVISLDRTPAKIDALKAALPAVHSIKADVTSNDDLNHAIEAIGSQFGKIDVLFNNAGKGSTFHIDSTPEEELLKNVDVEMAINYRTPIALTKKALPLLKKSSNPIVIVNTSGLAYMPIAYLGGYCASKTAAHFITMSMRHQLQPLKIRVVEVLPPNVDTELNTNKGVKKMSVEEFTRIFLNKLEKGQDVINVGESAMLEKISRLFPKLAFKMLNK